jgi:hypothetical protein
MGSLGETPEYCLYSGALLPPVRNLAKSSGVTSLEQTHQMTNVLEFMDIRPDLGLPTMVVDGTGTAGGAARVPLDAVGRGGRPHCGAEFDKDRADVFNLILFAENVFITQEVTQTQAARRNFGFGTGREGPVFGARALGGVACHPEGFIQGHGFCRPV